MADINLEDNDGGTIIITGSATPSITLEDSVGPTIDIDTTADGRDGAPGQGVPNGGTTGQVLSKIDGTDYNTQWTTSTSSGTVTSVSVTTANGVSGSVANPTTTPAITLALGAITPSSVVSSGSITGTNLSGTNTGDQTSVTGNAGTATTLATPRTIGTLTGDVTTAGSSFNGSANNTNATVLATVNSNVGSFGSSSNVGTFTVNGKGLTTAAASVAIQIAESQVTNLVSDLAAKQGTLSLTTTGTSGASTLVGNTLNIPQYSGGGGGSGITRSISSISSLTTAGSAATTDYVYLVSGTTTLTLPTAVGNTNRYSVTNTGTNTVTIATTSSQTINGSTTATLPIPNMSLDFVSNNSNWIVE